MLPLEVLSCDKGRVFSSESLQCEECPAGTAEEDGACVQFDAMIGVVVPLRIGGGDAQVEPWVLRYAAAAAMAAVHINPRDKSVVQRARELLPEGFKLVVDIQDSSGLASVVVDHAVAWNRQGRHAIVGSYRSEVTGPLALAASIEATPVVVSGAPASSLSDLSSYPTLSRVVLSNEAQAGMMMRSFSRALGWGRVAVLRQDNLFGRCELPNSHICDDKSALTLTAPL